MTAPWLAIYAERKPRPMTLGLRRSPSSARSTSRSKERVRRPFRSPPSREHVLGFGVRRLGRAWFGGNGYACRHRLLRVWTDPPPDACFRRARDLRARLTEWNRGTLPAVFENLRAPAAGIQGGS